MLRPLNWARLSEKGNRHYDLQTDNEKLDVSLSCARTKARGQDSPFAPCNVRYDIYTIHDFSSSPFR